VLERRVAAIVGPRDERLEDSDALPRLRRLARRLLGRPLTADERRQLRTLLLVKRAAASVIYRVLVAWRHGIGERDVRRMMRTLKVALDEDGNDITGQPVIHKKTKEQMVDANGQPATHQPRPRVKLIYR
jgi:hypothetical protein